MSTVTLSDIIWAGCHNRRSVTKRVIWCCVRDVACEREARLWPTLLQIPLQTLVFQEALDLTTDYSRRAISTRTIGATSTAKDVHNPRA